MLAQAADNYVNLSCQVPEYVGMLVIFIAASSSVLGQNVVEACAMQQSRCHVMRLRSRRPWSVP
jgi:hypothetical protein